MNKLILMKCLMVLPIPSVLQLCVEESFGAYMMNTIDAMAGLGLDLNLK